ncbi:MAG: hypothetical protein P8012_00130 [Desulfobacterales bacterium]
MPKLSYKAHKTLSRFHHSKAFHRAIRGPRGSGKSTGCCVELGIKGQQQAPYHDLRQTRFAIVRDTYRELEDTTIKTWCRWYPEEFTGPINRGTMSHTIRQKLPDGTMWEMEALFRALDRPGDIKKTLSLELTGAYINEAKNTPFGIISGLDDAIGRFPPKDLSVGFNGPTWAGMILDTNSPDDDHWWYKLDEQFRNGELDPKAWQFFDQPGGLIERGGKFFANPKAENLENLPDDFYLMRMVGKSKDHIRVYYCNQYGFVIDGMPVHPDYVDATHCPGEEINPAKGRAVIVGIDFGLTPAATFGQQLVNGRWVVFDELVTERMGADNFGRELKLKIQSEYPDFKFKFYGDPAGGDDSQTDERTCFQVLATHGINAEPAVVKSKARNDTEIRRGALRAPLTRMIDGKPGILISPKCKVLRKALSGGFCFKKKQIVGSEQYHATPDKNKYSHVAEACEYMCIGGGEGERLIEAPPQDVDTSLWDLNIEIDHGAGDASLGWMG